VAAERHQSVNGQAALCLLAEVINGGKEYISLCGSGNEERLKRRSENLLAAMKSRNSKQRRDC